MLFFSKNISETKIEKFSRRFPLETKFKRYSGKKSVFFKLSGS